MAVAFVRSATGTSAASTTSITVTFTAPAADNLLVLAVAMDKASGAVGAAPTGWTLLASQSGTQASHAIWYKIATGSETTVTATWTTTAAAGSGAVVAEFSGVDTTSPVSTAVTPVYDNTASTTWVVDPPAADVTAGGMACVWLGVDTATAFPWTLSATGWTNRVSAGAAGGKGTGALMTYNTALTASQDLASQTFTTPESDQHSGSAWIINAESIGTAATAAGSITLSGTVTPQARSTVTGSISLGGTVTPLAETLVDTFDTQDTAKWTGFGTNVAVSGGSLNITPTTGYPRVEAVGLFNMLGSYFGGELLQRPAMTTGTSASTSLIARIDASNYIELSIETNGRVGGRYTNAGVANDIYFTGHETATNYRIRISSARVITWETYESGAWIVVRTATAPAGWNLSSMILRVLSGNFVGTDTGPIPAKWGSVNVDPPTGTPATATGSITLGGTAIGVSSAAAIAAGSITLDGASTGVASAAISGAISLSGAPAARAAATSTGTISLSGTATASTTAAATATGAVTLGGTPTARAAAATSGTISLSGTAPTVSAAAAPTGTISLSGAVPTSGAAASTAGTISLSGAATVGAATAATGGVTLGGTPTARAGTTAVGAITLGGAPTARAAAVISGSVTLGGTATGGTYPASATLVDTFDSATGWTLTSGAAITGGELVLTATTAYPRATSVGRYNILGSHFGGRLTQRAIGTVGNSTVLRVAIDATNTIELSVSQTGGVGATLKVNNVSDSKFPGLIANATHYRIRVATDRIITWEAMVGGVWFTIRTDVSAPAGWDLTQVQGVLMAGFSAGDTNTTPARWTSVGVYNDVTPTLTNTNVNFGAATGGAPPTATELSTLASVVGRQPTVELWYRAWVNELDPADLEEVRLRGHVSLLTWEAWSWGPGNTSTVYNLANITRGDFDTYITRQATTLRDWGYEIYLRPLHEMNHTAYPWCVGVNGNAISDFIPAWNHIRDIFISVGATNVKFVWSPNQIAGTNTLAALYPGNTKCDAIALDAYNFGGTGWVWPANVFDGSFTEIRALTGGNKSLWIGETASATSGGDKAAWITEFFNWLRVTQDIDTFNWFDIDKEQFWALDTANATPEVRSAFATGLSTLDPAPTVGTPLPGGITLGGTVTARAAAATLGGISLGGSTTVQARATAVGTITLGGTSTPQVSASAAGSVSLGGTPVAQAPVAAAGSITLGGTTVARAEAVVNGSITLAGSVTPRAATTAVGSIALSGAAASGSVLRTAAGAVTLGGSSTAQAPSAIALGSITLSSASAVQARAAAVGAITLSGSATYGTGSLLAAGSITLGGASTAQVLSTSLGSVTLAGTPVAQARATLAGVITISGTAGAAPVQVTAGGLIVIGGAVTARVPSTVAGLITLSALAEGHSQTLLQPLSGPVIGTFHTDGTGIANFRSNGIAYAQFYSAGLVVGASFADNGVGYSTLRSDGASSATFTNDGTSRAIAFRRDGRSVVVFDSDGRGVAQYV